MENDREMRTHDIASLSAPESRVCLYRETRLMIANPIHPFVQ